MRHNKTKRMMEYWMSLYADGGAAHDQNGRHIWPERSDINPSACHELLGDMFILEIGHHESRYRLAGTRLCSMHGREMKNELFAKSYDDRDQATAENWAAGIGTEDYMALICSDAKNALGDVLPVETLLMPLNHHTEPGQRALGITVALENPFWLGSLDIAEQTIRSVRLLRPWEEKARLTGTADSSFVSRSARSAVATPPLSYIGAAANPALAELAPTSVPYLRVLDGGKQ